jgi:lipid-binding SYLF domain-containing protein
MTDFTRRQAFTVGAGAAAAVAMPLGHKARAATPPSGKQAAGWYRYKI